MRENLEDSHDRKRGSDKKVSWQTYVQTFATLIQVMTVVAGVVISILSFNFTRTVNWRSERLKQRNTQIKEAMSLNVGVSRRQSHFSKCARKYMEAIKVAGVLATPADRTKGEITAAKKRFAELYYAELALVESKDTETAMISLASSLGMLSDPTPEQQETLQLAHVLRDSLITAWGVDQRYVGPVNK
jgi:hypothetical protein